MIRSMPIRGVILSVVSAGLLGIAVCPALAEESALVVEPAASELQLQPAILPAPVAAFETSVVPPAPLVHRVTKIDYDVTRAARKRFAGTPLVEVAMVAQNPADGCLYEIPLCLPACCTGEPQVASRYGLLGRGIVTYCYDCGLEVVVKFRLRGDVEVQYGG